MAAIVREIRIALSADNNPTLMGFDISNNTLYIGLTYDKYVKFAKWVQADLDRRFPWHKHPLYQWAQSKIGNTYK